MQTNQESPSRTSSSHRPKVDPYQRVTLRGITFWQVTEQQCAEHIAEQAALGTGGWLVTPNLETLRQCDTDPKIHEMVRSADMIVADGMPLIWTSRILGTPLPERVCGSNLISSLSAEAAKRDLRIFLLGGADDTSGGTAELLRQRHPGIQVVGAYGPPFGFEKDDAEMARIEDMLREAKPNIVFFALPFPKGEFVMHRIRHTAPDAWWCGIGVSFSFMTGDVQRAPKWMQQTGLEWVHRLKEEPQKLVRRYLVHGVPFAINLLARAPIDRLRGRS